MFNRIKFFQKFNFKLIKTTNSIESAALTQKKNRKKINDDKNQMSTLTNENLLN